MYRCPHLTLYFTHEKTKDLKGQNLLDKSQYFINRAKAKTISF